MSSLHYEKKHKPSGGKGFYIALGVCLIAIGVASWTTYDSVVKFTEEESSSSSYTQSTQQTQNNVEGVQFLPVKNQNLLRNLYRKKKKFLRNQKKNRKLWFLIQNPLNPLP